MECEGVSKVVVRPGVGMCTQDQPHPRWKFPPMRQGARWEPFVNPENATYNPRVKFVIQLKHVQMREIGLENTTVIGSKYLARVSHKPLPWGSGSS